MTIPRVHPALKFTFVVLALGLISASAPVSANAPTGNKEAAKAPSENTTSKRKARKRKKKSSAPKKSQKRPVTASDYAQWERLGGQQISNNGRWLAYQILRVDDERTLHVHDLRSKKSAPKVSFKQGERPRFSEDSAWLAVTTGKSPAEIKKAKKAGDKAPPEAGKKLKLRRLKDGETTELEHVGGFSFSPDSQFAAIGIVPKSNRKAPARGPSSTSKAAPGKILIVRDLSTGIDTSFGNIVKHAWSDTGSLLAMVVDSPSISNALQVFDPARGVLRTLETSDQEYAGLTWRKDSMDLAVMREMKHGEKEDVSHVILAWRGLNKAKPAKLVFAHESKKGFPKDMYITSGGLQWSKDGKSIYCDLRKWEKKPKKEEANKKDEADGEKKESAKKTPPSKGSKGRKGKGKKKPEAAPEVIAKTLRETIEEDSNVEVWHSRDVDIMPYQKKQADRDKNPKRRAVWWLETGNFVQLGNELTEDVTILPSGTRAVGRDRTPHERAAMFGPRLEDVFIIDTKTGKRKRILEGVEFLLTASPNSRYLLYLQDGQIWSHEVKTGRQRDLTGDLDSHFTDQQDDSLKLEKPPYGKGVWLKDGSAVLLYDRFDIWCLTPDGSRAVKLTAGAGDKIRHRLSQASFHEDDDGALDPKKPVFVALYGELTKKSGYARLRLDRNKKKPERVNTLVWEDLSISALMKAKDAGTYTFIKQGSNDSPDLFAGRSDLRKARRITNTNPFQKDFRWGRSELVDFKNKDGVDLQGMLTYPSDYKPGRKYPMIVYIYEKRSQDLNRYIIPTEKHPYNQSVYSAEGYFVFQPDIVYRPQEPGPSALDCVVSAVEQVLEKGMIDEKRIGLVGHSWGAYQTAFIVTRTDLFAAGVAGAPLTDMMSMAASVYWNSGQPNARIFSQSQGRMDKPFWRDVDNYVRNSPIHGLDELKTPLLIAFGDKDGAVDWDQGIQMYNAARWADKDNFVMLVYPGENHALRKEENMVDYHYRVLEWFGHYLKGSEAPKWITSGKSFLERQKELEEKKEKKEKKPDAKTEKPGSDKSS